MNTIRTAGAVANSSILAIDLGKYKSVACLHDQASGEIRFTSLDTSRAELRRLIDKEQAAVVIIEACLLAGWVHDPVNVAKGIFRCFKCQAAGNQLDLWATATQQPLFEAAIDLCRRLRRDVPYLAGEQRRGTRTDRTKPETCLED